ncbi:MULTISPECIES: hypothetical protein [unclassified Clostridium]|uniref:hypothetical protein n=1 Tax=unclassified Clostridium TaxID=2614128 RepID=UPI00207ACEFB|nr:MULTISPECIES: hypothetical protein [unclassified Clostridium]
MKNEPIKEFIKALSEWNEMKGESNISDLQTLIFLLNHSLGADIDSIGLKCSLEESIELLEKRVIELTEKQGINQILIVQGLISYVTKYFDGLMKSAFEQLQMYFELKKQGKDHLADSKMFEKFKDSKSRFHMENDKIVWNTVLATRLNEAVINDWEYKEILEKSKKFKFN